MFKTSLSPSFSTIKKRADFVRVAKEGARFFSKYFILNALPTDKGGVRVGYVATKKNIGKAVDRNFAKRRMRELMRSLDFGSIGAGMDIVVVSKKVLLETKFDVLKSEVQKQIEMVFREASV